MFRSYLVKKKVKTMKIGTKVDKVKFWTKNHKIPFQTLSNVRKCYSCQDINGYKWIGWGEGVCDI